MYANATQVKNNFGEYLKRAQKDEVRIRKNGVVVAVLRGVEQERKSITAGLSGIIPATVDETAARSKRLSRQ
jgi:prevent-host-death family protein